MRAKPQFWQLFIRNIRQICQNGFSELFPCFCMFPFCMSRRSHFRIVKHAQDFSFRALDLFPPVYPVGIAGGDVPNVLLFVTCFIRCFSAACFFACIQWGAQNPSFGALELVSMFGFNAHLPFLQSRKYDTFCFCDACSPLLSAARFLHCSRCGRGAVTCETRAALFPEIHSSSIRKICNYNNIRVSASAVTRASMPKP